MVSFRSHYQFTDHFPDESDIEIAARIQAVDRETAARDPEILKARESLMARVKRVAIVAALRPVKSNRVPVDERLQEIFHLLWERTLDYNPTDSEKSSGFVHYNYVRLHGLVDDLEVSAWRDRRPLAAKFQPMPDGKELRRKSEPMPAEWGREAYDNRRRQLYSLYDYSGQEDSSQTTSYIYSVEDPGLRRQQDDLRLREGLHAVMEYIAGMLEESRLRSDEKSLTLRWIVSGKNQDRLAREWGLSESSVRNKVNAGLRYLRSNLREWLWSDPDIVFQVRQRCPDPAGGEEIFYSTFCRIGNHAIPIYVKTIDDLPTRLEWQDRYTPVIITEDEFVARGGRALIEMTPGKKTQLTLSGCEKDMFMDFAMGLRALEKSRSA